MRIYNDASVRFKRKKLRKDQTDAEAKLWHCLRGKRLCGVKFFRQYSIGPYIADFYCPDLRVAVEVDGGHHYSEEGLAYDRERELFFESLNIKTVRFSNLEVLNQMDGVLKSLEVLMERSSL